MANSELVDALCTALVEARQEKQALAAALDECFAEQEDRVTEEDPLDEEETEDGDEEEEEEDEEWQ